MNNVWLAAITAAANIFILLTGNRQKTEEKKEEVKDELKERMHMALLSGDSTAIAMCLNEYKQLRRQAKAASD